jgi:hypothetical protein
MTPQERKALLDCRNMLNHLMLFAEMSAFDRENVMKRIDAADEVMFTPVKD